MGQARCGGTRCPTCSCRARTPPWSGPSQWRRATSDVAVLRGRFPLEGPYPFGHEGVAEVVEVGAGVRSVAVGDIVVVPFQISCGRCPACTRGRTGNCAAHPPLSTFGLGPMGGLEWGGLLADR